MTFDTKLSEYELLFLHPDIEHLFISKNELLTSFAISKAEQSQLTLQEARQLYTTLTATPEYNFLTEKLQTKKRLTQHDYDKVEFLNIAKTIRHLNRESFSLNALTLAFIQELHAKLTHGLDVFATHLPVFDVYISGVWRETDAIRVGAYQPAPYEQIPSGVDELVRWLKDNPTVTNVAIFHTALYALHPFRNGNKRVCRVLEYLCLRSLELNTKNLYSTSYYYHQEKSRYYKYLLSSLERRNLNHFVTFVQEAFTYSICGVLKTSLEIKRKEFCDQLGVSQQQYSAIRPLLTHREVQFKNLARYTRGKISRQTLVNYLQQAVSQHLVQKRVAGRTTFYRLNMHSIETEMLIQWLTSAQQRLKYIPETLSNELA